MQCAQPGLFAADPKWYRSEPKIPQFTILNARGGDWQCRKRAWLREIGDGTAGRTAAAVDIHNGRNGNTIDGAPVVGGVSGFDPVLAELLIRWYSREGWQVVDPFAGGVTRGAVATLLGRRYWGCDLSAAQVEANNRSGHAGTWVHGGALASLPNAPLADLILSCPPYGSLERYSNDPCDLSAMAWPAFARAYMAIASAVAGRLKPDRFAAFVVGNFRDRRACNGVAVSQDRPLRDLVGLTVRAFEAAGLRFYDEAHLVTPVGTLAARTAYVWPRGRKLGRSHQTVLVFAKGDALGSMR